MSGPYRVPDERAEDRVQPIGAVDLGARRSPHARTSVIAGWPEVDLHENGLVVHSPDLGHLELPFEAVDALHYDYEGILSRAPRVTLVGYDGVRTTLPNDLHDLERILAELDRQVTEPLLALARKALASGERMVFGPLAVELDGLVLNGHKIAWESLSRVDAERDALVFYGREPLGRCGLARVRDVPHPRVLLELLRTRTTVVARGLPLLA